MHTLSNKVYIQIKLKQKSPPVEPDRCYRHFGVSCNKKQTIFARAVLKEPHPGFPRLRFDTMPAGDSNSIVARNCKAAKECEALLWQALCGEADTAMDYIESDCVFMNPLVHPDRSFEALTSNSSPTLSEGLEKLAHSKHRWTSYHLHTHNPEPAFAQPAMMAVQIMYKVTLIRERHRQHHHQEQGNLETVNAFCTSTWRQGSGGGWKLCAQQLVPVSG